jgi:hypothetical protein
MQWQKEIISLIQQHYKVVGIKYTATDNVHKCLIDFMNLEMKLIKPVPRNVFISKELKSRIIPIENRLALISIENKIRTGIDVNYHKNKGTFDPTYNDLLLNDWIIHHLHLSDKKTNKNQRFYDRTKYVLFAAFNPTQAFLIDIRTHGKNGEPHVFARKELLEIMDNNWPTILKDYNVEDDIKLTHNPTDEEIDTARKKGLTFFATKVNERAIINPGIGITTSGHNIHIVKRANEIVRYIQESLMEIDKDTEGIKMALSEQSGHEIKELDIQIHMQAKWPFFYVYEKNSGYSIEKNYDKIE